MARTRDVPIYLQAVGSEFNNISSPVFGSGRVVLFWTRENLEGDRRASLSARENFLVRFISSNNREFDAVHRTPIVIVLYGSFHEFCQLIIVGIKSVQKFDQWRTPMFLIRACKSDEII